MSSNASIRSSSESGVSHYQVSESVTYQVELNYTFSHTRISPQSYYYKVARLNDREPNSTITQYCPPYQQSQLLYNSITGYDTIIYGSLDQFNNTYDLFNATLSFSDTITLSQKYIITLNEVSFDNIQSSDIGTYNTSDPMFDLYCNKSETYYERNDPDLIAASNSIVSPTDNPLEKARKIANWVADYLTYDGTLPAQEMGASWAYDNKRGDCSEYSTLMITLLRIQGIPARKVTGYLLSTNSGLKPDVGQVFNFNANSLGTTNILGHAWVEYYIPNIGWIAAEPQNPSYYKKIDFLRFNLNIGAWFFMPGATPPYDYVSEFPIIPSPVCYDHGAYTFDYTMKITVIDTNYITFDFITLIIIIGIVAAVVVVIMLIIRSGKKKRAAEINY
ncbi:MAG: transglutaminase family protein [Candidatus Hermodarchaeota archaeon]